MAPDAQTGPRGSVEHLYVDLIAEKLARAITGNYDLMLFWDVSSVERRRLKEIARQAIDAAKEGKP